MAVIERYFHSDETLARIARDFRNLIRIVDRSHGELSIQLRKNYFNVYYRGNSLARVTPTKSASYLVEIHEKFVEDPVRGALSSWASKKSGRYRRWLLNGTDVVRFFTKVNVTNLGAQIASVNNGEEITFEQILMTDNPPSKKLVIIDRQVTDSKLRKQMDILALTRASGSGAYRFLVIEVKLGKNPELRGSVAGQLNNYVSHIRDNIDDYIACYTRNFSQKHQLGLVNFEGSEASIEIEPVVEGVVVVGGYSGIASGAISELKTAHPDIQVKVMRNSLT
jgi:hypothetical protein